MRRGFLGSAARWLVRASMLANGVVVACGCGAPPPPRPIARATPVADAAGMAAVDASSGGAVDAAAFDVLDAGAPVAILDSAPAPPPDPMATHKDSRDDLLALIDVPSPREAALLRGLFGTDGPGQMNQGNKSLARHKKSREECLAGLKDIVIQTPEQRATCGAENMVPVAAKGKDPAYCIDVFEFPNRACELPIVWSSPSGASNVCKLQGKRLCTQSEWQLACRGDPEGGKDRRYAYGDKLDLDVCNTHRPHRLRCNPLGSKTAWATCATDTEPSGSFPSCRSRFGVFDQHGNVAEEMSRKDVDGKVVSQLKGSAWFYSEVAREPDRPIPASTPYKESAHSDTCNFDPRWHVEPLEAAVHVNYHLGFRCCKGL